MKSGHNSRNYGTLISKKNIDKKSKSAFVEDVVARTESQSDYFNKLGEYKCLIGVGPAGTGKTYLAIAKAVEALETQKVRRIVLVRPAVSAGEEIGFLPGGVEDKISPYMEPMKDALAQVMGTESAKRLINSGDVELAPIAFMRGRTLRDAFVVIDESQNLTFTQVKMVSTRLGDFSQVVLNGDLTQCDLELRHGEESGLKIMLDGLKKHGDSLGLKTIGYHEFTGKDVVRSETALEAIKLFDHIAKVAKPKGNDLV